MKMKRIITCSMIFVMVCAMLLSGCMAEPLPETKGEEIGVYVLNDIFVDADGVEILEDGVPVYRFDEDGNIVTSGDVADVVVVAAENIAHFSCVSDVLVNEADTKKTIPVYVLSDGSEMYGTVTWSMPIMVGPENVVNSSFTVESADAGTLYFNEGESKLEFDGTKATTLKLTGCYSGDEKLIISNCLGEIVKTVDISIVAATSTDEAAIAEIEAKVASCVHEYVPYVVPATETSEGYTQYTCKSCAHAYRTDYTEKLPCTHSLTGREVKATCTEKGYTLLTCSKCGYTEKTNYTELAAHTFTDEIIPSTCSEKGYTLHTCTICKYEEKDNYTELKDHTYKHETVASTCSAEGYTLHTCTVCKANYKDNYTATKAHTYVISTVAATYTQGGYTLHTCNVCGDSYKDGHTNKLACTNHSYVETARTEASCSAAGSVSKTCSRCGATTTETLGQNSHSYSDNIVQPTCTSDGYTTHTCGTCGTSYSDTNIPALGHDWQTSQSQEVIGSEEHVICSQCGCDFTATGTDINSHIKAHVLNGEGGAYYGTLVPIYGDVTATTCSRCGASQ